MNDSKNLYDRQAFGYPPFYSHQGSNQLTQWHGVTNCTSVAGGLQAVIPSAIVDNNTLFTAMYLKPLGTAGAWSGQVAVTIGVRTVAPGSSFILGTVGSVALVGSFAIGWAMALR